MTFELNALEARLVANERALSEHKGDDNQQFAALRGDIAKLGSDLGKRIDAIGVDVDRMKLDEAHAEGKAEGAASIKAAISAPKWWHPIIITAVSLMMMGSLGLVGWMGNTIFQQKQTEIDALRSEIDALRSRPTMAAAAPSGGDQTMAGPSDHNSP